jgi:hypothetical protein
MKKTWIAALVLAGAGVSAWATAPGAMAAAPAPLPEPETYAVLLTGLAALTLLGRRPARAEQRTEHPAE